MNKIEKIKKGKNREIINKIEKRIMDSRVKDAIEYLDLIVDKTGLMDEDVIYENTEDFFNRFYHDDTLGALRAIKYGNYNFDDEYVVFNYFSNLDTYNFVELKDYIKYLAPEMAEIFAEDYIKGEGKFKGLEIYKDL